MARKPTKLVGVSPGRSRNKRPTKAEPAKQLTTMPRSIVNALPSSVALAKTQREAIKALDALRYELKKATSGGALTTARAMVAMRRLKDLLEDTNKDFGVLYEHMKSVAVPDVFDAAGVTNVPLAEGFRVTTSTQLYASIRPGRQKEAMAWLHEHGLGDLISNTVNSSSLSSASRAMLIEHNLEPPSEIFTLAFVENTSVAALKQ